MSWEFKVGAQVVCLKADAWSFGPREIAAGCRGPKKGDVCTIRAIFTRPDDPDVGLWLQEIRNPPISYLLGGRSECAFRSCWFRPVRRTDISELRGLLAPGPKARAKEDA